MVNQSDLEILTHTFSALYNINKWFLKCHLPAYVQAYIDKDICSSLLPEELGRYYSYLVLKSSSTIGQCLVNMENPSPKIGALYMSTKNQNGDFLITILIKFQWFMETSP
jgi:hypothetical protein